MDDYEDSIKLVYYVVDKFENFSIHIYFNEFDLKNLRDEMINDNSLPEEVLLLKDNVPKLAGEKNNWHIYYERKRFYAINADGSAHNFRTGLQIQEPILGYFRNKFKNFRLMDKNRLESGMQNKVFFIQLIVKDAAKINQTKSDNS